MGLKLKVAKNKADKDQTFAVRYKVFIEELGFDSEKKFTEKKEHDLYDTLPGTVSLLALKNGKGIAAARLIKPNPQMKNSNNIFGLPIENLYDLSAYKKQNIAPCEISRSATLKNNRSSRIMMDIWKISYQYSLQNNIKVYCSCTGTETDSGESARLIFELIKLKGYLHPDIYTKPLKTRPAADNKKQKNRYPLYNKYIIKKIKNAGGLNQGNLEYFQELGLDLPATLKYFIRIGGKFTGPPVLYPQFSMFTLPWVLVLEDINEPFKTFFSRKADYIEL
ncbi:MAG TPA: GNAT family N-acyltransferase [Spirochaetota bacterium]|nr:GNAT family N-acyltransferase [Spirochaetota bacterium]